MNKYLLLVLINAPLILTGVIRAITRYNTPPKISKSKCVTEVIFWLAVGVALIFAQPFYNTLIRHNLTDSTPMSLFDVALLTLVLFCVLLIVETKEELTSLKRTISRIHENLAIVEAEERQKKK